MFFVKIQEIISEDNIRAKNELKDLYAQMEEVDEEAKLKAIESQEIMEIDKEQTNTFSIKSKVNSENDLTLCLAISKSAEESISPNVEGIQMLSRHAATTKESCSPSFSKNNTIDPSSSSEKLHEDTPSCSVQ